MVASTLADEQAGNARYQQGHMGLIFKEGFSFSGFERDGVYLNLGGAKYKDISGVSGMDSILDGRAVVVADLDNDGDEDIFLTTIQDQAHQLFRNNVGQDAGFLRVELTGTTSGPDAFGAVIRLKSSHGIQTRIKSGGNGFLAQSDDRVLFGLGGDRKVDWLEVIWPSGGVDRFTNLPVSSSIRIREGSGHFDVLKDRSFSLPDPLQEEEKLWHKLSLERGEPFPEVSLLSIGVPVTGEPMKLQRLEEGKPYFLNLWATWCGPCRKEMPELERLHPVFAEKGIELIGVNVDVDASSQEVLEFLEHSEISYPNYRLDQDEWNAIFTEGNLFVPFSIYVDGEGRVRKVFAGSNPGSQRSIHRLLGLDAPEN